MTPFEQIKLLREALGAAKIEHHVNEDDPHFSCHATESSINYYDDPQIVRRPSPVCDCGADEHNARIDAALAATEAAPAQSPRSASPLGASGQGTKVQNSIATPTEETPVASGQDADWETEAMRAEMQRRNAAPVPSIEATDGIARDIVIFLTMQGPHYGSKLYRHLENLGEPYPKWLFDLIPNKDHTPPMGAFAEAICRLVSDAAPVPHDAVVPDNFIYQCKCNYLAKWPICTHCGDHTPFETSSAVRVRVLEEAAQLCEAVIGYGGSEWSKGYDVAARHLADAIRALKVKP